MRSLLPVLMLSTLLTLTQCVCQSRRADAPPTPKAETQSPTAQAEALPAAVEAPKSLDTKDLDEDEIAVLVNVLSEQFDPCGSPLSFIETLKSEKPCKMALSAGDFVVNLVQKGFSKRQITVQLLKELARRSSKAEFQLDGVPAIGEPGAANQIVEFIDFQCPYCASVSGPTKELAKTYGATLYIKHLPLTDHHPLADLSARASIAAHAQGKFWPVYEAFFNNQASLTPDLIESLVKESGVDMVQYAKDLEAQSTRDHIARDISDADLAKVEGTPTLFLNGIMVEFDGLEAALKEATGK